MNSIITETVSRKGHVSAAHTKTDIPGYESTNGFNAAGNDLRILSYDPRTTDTSFDEQDRLVNMRFRLVEYQDYKYSDTIGIDFNNAQLQNVSKWYSYPFTYQPATPISHQLNLLDERRNPLDNAGTFSYGYLNETSDAAVSLANNRRSFSIVNWGTEDYTINPAAVTVTTTTPGVLAGASDFELIAPSSWNVPANGGVVTFQVALSNGAKATHTGTLSFPTGDGAVGSIGSINLVANVGAMPARMMVEYANSEGIQPTATDLVEFHVNADESATMKFYVSNLGDSDLPFTPTFSDTLAGFSISKSSTPSSIMPHETIAVEVKYDDTGSSSTATLTILSSDGTFKPAISVGLAGFTNENPGENKVYIKQAIYSVNSTIEHWVGRV